MGIFDWRLVNLSKVKKEQRSTNSVISDLKNSIVSLNNELNDLKLAAKSEADPKKITEVIKERRRTLQKPLHYRTPNPASVGYDRKDIDYIYYGPGYDLAEIGRAIDIEPYINQSVRKHREQILKEGYHINGQDEELVQYVKKRLFEMSIVSGVTTQQWLREFTTNLVAYGTAFLVIKRDAERSNGKVIRMYGKDREPMAAIYPLDPTSVTVALNDYGHPVRWKQTLKNPIGNKAELVFEADDVIVATIDKKPGFVFGSPYILPTLDDVRTLRRLEEIAELLGQRNAFPLMHFKVGTEDAPTVVFDDGTSEIDLVRSLVENMPKEGGLVTSNRVEAALLGGDKQVIDLVPYLDYFEARVLGGLRLSETDLGRTSASKASAITVSQGLEDSARDFQAVISDVLTFYLLLPLCLEGGFDVDPVENQVSLEFTMINREEDRANQAHGNDLYLSGSITHDEVRRDFLKKKPLSEEEKANLKPNMDHEQAKELQNIAGEQAIAKAKVSKSTAVKNKSANKTRPTNQHGRKSSKTRVTKNSLDLLKESYSFQLLETLKDARAGLWEVFDRHATGVVSDDKNVLSTKEEDISETLNNFVNVSLIECAKILEPIMRSGIRDAFADLEIEGDPSSIMPKKNIDRFYKNYIAKSLRGLSESIKSMINNDEGLAGIKVEKPLELYVNAIFEHATDELKSLASKHIDAAYKVGYAKTVRTHGFSSIILSPDENGTVCEQCADNGDQTISLIDKNGSYANILETHLGCDFVISVGEK